MSLNLRTSAIVREQSREANVVDSGKPSRQLPNQVVYHAVTPTQSGNRALAVMLSDRVHDKIGKVDRVVL